MGVDVAYQAGQILSTPGPEHVIEGLFPHELSLGGRVGFESQERTMTEIIQPIIPSFEHVERNPGNSDDRLDALKSFVLL
jgi:hypothetical protein